MISHRPNIILMVVSLYYVCPTGNYTRCWYSIVAPEWIMAWKGIELDAQTPAGKQVMLSSNLSRNLNSGDSIVLLWSARNTTEGAIGVTSIMLVHHAWLEIIKSSL